MIIFGKLQLICSAINSEGDPTDRTERDTLR